MTAAQMADILARVDTLFLTAQSVEQTQDVVIELQQEQQAEGTGSDGQDIHWLRDEHYPYTLPYARKKAAMGLQTTVVDLKLTGAFYKAEVIKIEGENLQFSSTDEKAQYLEKNYGTQIFGLTDENQKAYREGAFSQAFRENFSQATGLTFQAR